MITGAIADRGIFVESSAFAETKIIPSVAVSERYDTNVFFAPAQFLPPGTQLWDVVTTVAPEVQVLNKSRGGDTSIKARVTSSAYTYNPDLNYIGTNLDLDSTLDGWISELIPRAKLRVVDLFQYTPEAAGFLTGVKPQQIENPFARGVQLARANTFQNIGVVMGEYALTQTTSFRGSYSYSIFRAGSVFVQTGAGAPQFFDTNLQNWTAGPSIRLAQEDRLNLTYEGTQANQELVTTPGEPQQNINFTAQGFVPEYVKETPRWTAKVKGGGTLLQQGNILFFTGGLSLTGNYDPFTKILFSVSRALTPSYFIDAGAFISTTLRGSIERKLSDMLTLDVGANYATGETAPTVTATLQSYAANAVLSYQITRSIFTALSYNYSYIDFAGVGAAPFELERNVAMVSITGRWP